MSGKTYCPNHAIGWANGHTRTSTPEHKAWRKAVLDRDHWWCQIKGPKCEGRAKHADHITPVAQGGAELDVSNGQAACAPCHKAKSQGEAAFGRWGPSTPPPRY